MSEGSPPQAEHFGRDCALSAADRCTEVRSILQSVIAGSPDFVELRHHSKRVRSVTVERDRIHVNTWVRSEGTGARVLAGGSFGFAACTSLDPERLRATVAEARRAAGVGRTRRRGRVTGLAPADFAHGHFDLGGVRELSLNPPEALIELAHRFVHLTLRASPRVSSAACTYSEVLERRVIASTDGADCSLSLARPEVWVTAIAEDAGQRCMSRRSTTVTGGWGALLRDEAAATLSTWAAAAAVDQIRAKAAEVGRSTVILAPSLVGLLAHEAIGHGVEADFVQAGSAAAGKIGQAVASELVTLCDSGSTEYGGHPAGSMPFDDEGVLTRPITIIKDGVLRSYLHDRESAFRYGSAATGNARAWDYHAAPLIRMRNTYVVPGRSSLDDMIASVDDGFLLDGPRNGQADADGEFMFGVERARRIRRGKLAEAVKTVTVSGLGYDVLHTIDAVSSDFAWGLGAGGCSKKQAAHVDAGGPFVRCQLLIGGGSPPVS